MPTTHKESLVVDMLKVFQANMSKQHESVSDKLDSIDSRMISLESRQKTFEEEFKDSKSISGTSSSSTPAIGCSKRHRCTPTAMQVCNFM